MTRRLVLAAGVLAAASLFSSCSSVDKPIASVNGVEIDRDTLEALAADPTVAEIEQVTVTDAPAPGDVLSGEQARAVLTLLMRSEFVRQANAERNVTVSDEVRAQEEELLSQQVPSWSTASELAKSTYLDFYAGAQSLFSSAGLTPDELEAAYAEGPTTSGVVCVSHILVADEAAAQDVVDRLEGGEDFAAVAAEVSIDTGSGAAGGALTDPNTGGDCTDLATFSGSYVAEFVDGALAGQIGVPTAPVKSDFGYHIILLRPYADVAASVAQILNGPAQQELAAALFADAEVSVSPSLGKWSDDTRAVVPLDEAAPAA